MANKKNDQPMQLTHIYSYLVPAGKGVVPPPQISRANVPLTGQLYRVLLEVFERSETECVTAIRFLPDENGTQNNTVRGLICDMLRHTNIDRGQPLAERLRGCTTLRSRLGLFFLMIGRTDGAKVTHKIVLSRFPADEGIVASEAGTGLSIQFIERIFMKNKASYKAAVYRGASLDGGFWRGHVVDRQFDKNAPDNVANYWIQEFLLSDLFTTAAEGTRRFAKAVMAANKAADTVPVKEELVALSRLARNVAQPSSINDLLDRFQVSEAARELIRGYTPRGTADDRFQMDSEEYDKIVRYRTIRLDNGAAMTSLAEDFDQCFEREDLGDGRVRFATEGAILDDRLKTGVAS